MSVLYWEALSSRERTMLLATFVLRECCWLVFSLVSTRTPLILLLFQLSSIISPANIPEIKAQNPDVNL